nr:hypothetical protein [Actinomycetota bacterium]
YSAHRENCEACEPLACPSYISWKEHRDSCPACLGDAPLTHGPPCDRKREFIDHDSACLRCNPCATLITKIATLGEWLDARKLRSRAEWLRAVEEASA